MNTALLLIIISFIFFMLGIYCEKLDAQRKAKKETTNRDLFLNASAKEINMLYRKINHLDSFISKESYNNVRRLYPLGEVRKNASEAHTNYFKEKRKHFN